MPGSIKFANAPISWGVNEFGIESVIKPEKMLEELRLAGYEGTELGDRGFFPTETSELKAMLGQESSGTTGTSTSSSTGSSADVQQQQNERVSSSSGGVDMIGAFCCYALSDPKEHAKGRAYAESVAQQLAPFCDGSQSHPPHIVLSDSVHDPRRIEHTGRITKSMSLAHTDPAAWSILCQEISDLKQLIRGKYPGVEVYYHPHCGSYVETPWEIELLLHDVPDLKLIFDTAHITMGAHSRPRYLLELLDRFGDRVHSFHFKDYTPAARGKDYFELVANGCFPELGAGIVDFSAVRAWQLKNGWTGWIVVEQDILGPKSPEDGGVQSAEEVAMLQQRQAGNPAFQSALRNMAFLRELYRPPVAVGAGAGAQQSRL